MRDEEPLVSVVLPIYNVERYLDRCVSSVVDQTYGNLEIILVDDGSGDSSPKICDAWAVRDPRIRVVHKENQGAGMARNTGLEASSGDYIFFFDSDDFVDPDLVETCVRRASADGADVVKYGMRTVSEDGGEVLGEVVPSCPKGLFVLGEVTSELLPSLLGPDWDTGEDWRLMSNSWTTMYNARMLRECGFRFASEREVGSEDVYSALGLYGHVARVSVIERALYNYRVNPGQLTRVYRRDELERVRRFYLVSLELAIECRYPQAVRERLMATYVSFIIAALKRLAASGEAFEEKKRQVSALSKDDVFRNVYDGLRRKKHLGWKKRALLWSIHANCPHMAMLLCSIRMAGGHA